MDFESENERSHAGNKKKKKAYGYQGFLSVGEAMVNVEHIWDAARIRTEDQEARRFEAEMQQRDQHHQFQIGKQKEVLLRLRLELQRQEQSSWSNVQDSMEGTNRDQPSWLR